MLPSGLPGPAGTPDPPQPTGTVSAAFRRKGPAHAPKSKEHQVKTVTIDIETTLDEEAAARCGYVPSNEFAAFPLHTVVCASALAVVRRACRRWPRSCRSGLARLIMTRMADQPHAIVARGSVLGVTTFSNFRSLALIKCRQSSELICLVPCASRGLQHTSLPRESLKFLRRGMHSRRNASSGSLFLHLLTVQ